MTRRKRSRSACGPRWHLKDGLRVLQLVQLSYLGMCVGITGDANFTAVSAVYVNIMQSTNCAGNSVMPKHILVDDQMRHSAIRFTTTNTSSTIITITQT
jgi:hypothetical protein